MTHKTAFDAGALIPLWLDEVLPGDTYNVNMAAFLRLATPIYPILDNIYLDVFFFFVPNRLVWDNWQRFCGEQTDPDDPVDYTIPQAAYAPSSGPPNYLPDYLGIPPGSGAHTRTNTTVNALPFRGYRLIWNEWFRDQNLQDSVVVAKDDGPDDLSAVWDLLYRGKRHDYFTSCLPWPQKGAAVDLPLGDSAPISGTIDVVGDGSAPTFDTGDLNTQTLRALGSGGGVGTVWSGSETAAASDAVWTDPHLQGDGSTLTADLSSATAATINSLRQAFQIQKLLERDARGGTRYIELVKAHFGVTSPDARLQRPEFLGGGEIPVIINAVPQTSPKTTATGWTQTVKGSLAAYGTAAGSGIGFNKSFTEHGYLFCLVSARADLTYQQGLHRMWTRETKYDFYWPALSNIGEQAVLNKEIYYQGPDITSGSDIVDELVWGYQERWAEYRYSPSRISSVLRSEYTAPLDAWHLAIKNDTLPVLGDTFIKENPPIDRVIAVTSEPHFLCDSYFKIKCARPMPVYSVPGLIDHF